MSIKKKYIINNLLIPISKIPVLGEKNILKELEKKDNFQPQPTENEKSFFGRMKDVFRN